MWDSFLSGVAISIMQHGDSYLGENEFAEMEYLNITAVTSNEPYGVNDGSNPFLYGRAIPKFHLQKAGVHSGYVQTGPQDPFCFVKGGGKGKCQTGRIHQGSNSEAVQVLVAQRARPNQDVHSPMNRQFFNSFLDAGNVFSVPANKFAEFNMFLDPLAAKMAMESNLTITLVPLNAQLKVISFKRILQTLQLAEKTPESTFAHQLLSLLYQLQRKQPKLYHHMEIFLGELLGAVFLVDHSKLNPVMQRKLIRVLTGNLSQDGQIIVDKCGKSVNILDSFDSEAYYSVFAELLGDRRQSAVIGSFDEQKKMWSKPQ
ncbi:Inosine-uridine preferring nucleoside hydrolase [Musa troglodytarum]|uniref:Inosine-uridine preferring nucleoside hydrolase n=1 Tax=Musa troglodytarum TaxID=320322 RepID=A0A9E7FYK1_9LILI|nr:Inosine-uridine preferring nucleoside hydrolase [Musa troglodytarum]